MFEIAPLYTLDRITAYPQIPSYSLSSPLSSVPIIDPSQFAHTRNRSSVSEALQAAINSGIAAAANGMVVPKGGYSWSKNMFAKPLESVYSKPSSTIISLHEVMNPIDESKDIPS
jgi:hypothetical protein